MRSETASYQCKFFKMEGAQHVVASTEGAACSPTSLAPILENSVVAVHTPIGGVACTTKSNLKPSDLMKHFFTDFQSFEVVNNKGVAKSKWSGNCKMCVERKEKHITYKDVLGTTSNFCAHLRTSHAAEYGEFQQTPKPFKGKPLPKGQPTVTLLFAKGTVYSKTDPQQVKITNSYVENLVIRIMLPIYTCDTE